MGEGSEIFSNDLVKVEKRKNVSEKRKIRMPLPSTGKKRVGRSPLNKKKKRSPEAP